MSNERKEEEAKNEKLKAEEETLKKELSDLDGLLVKEKSRFRNFLEEKFDFDMGLWLGEDTPGADTLDIVSYLLAFVFLAGLIALSIVSGISSPFILPLAITTLVVLLYGFYRTVMPRQKWATNEQAAFIRLLGGDKLQIGERISEGLLCGFQAGFEPVDKKPNYVRLIENNEPTENLFYSVLGSFIQHPLGRHNDPAGNFLHFAVTSVTPTALDSFIQHPLGKRIANFLINKTKMGYTPLMWAILMGKGKKFSETQKQLIIMLLKLEEIDLNLTTPQSHTPLLLVCDNKRFLTEDVIRWEIVNSLFDKMPAVEMNIEMLEKSIENLSNVHGQVLQDPYPIHENENSKVATNIQEKKDVVSKIKSELDRQIYELAQLKRPSPVSFLLFPIKVPLHEPSTELQTLYKEFFKSSNAVEEKKLDEEQNYLKILAFAFQKASPTILNQLINRFKELKYFDTNQINHLVKFEEDKSASPLLTWVINPVRLKKLKGEEIIAKVKALIDIGALATGPDESGHHPLSLLTVPTQDLLGLDPKLVSNLVALLIKEDNTDSYNSTPALESMLNNVKKMDNEPLKLELQIAFYGELIRREVISADDKSIPEEVQKSLNQSHPPSSSP